MKEITKKIAKGLSVGIKVRKPHYYYQDIVTTYNTTTTKNIDLAEFEGLDFERSYSTLTFNDKMLWNNKLFNRSIRALAPLYKDKVVKYGGYSVVGSLANDNNVFSGFNGSNYLSLDGEFEVSDKTWEVVAKFTTTDSFPNLQGIYHCHNDYSGNGRYGLIVRMQGSKFNLTVASGYSWLINMTGSYTIQPNTTYWVKAKFDGSRYSLSYSLDGKTYIEDIAYSTTSTLLGGLKIMVAGVWYDGGAYIEPLLGTLDLNECYMKIDNNLVWTPGITEEVQQYIPEYLTTRKGLEYSVVGSPVVVNGIASEFTGASYVQIPNAFKPANESWEFVLKLTLTNNKTQQRLVGSVDGYYKTFSMEMSASGIICVGITSNGSSWNVCWMNGVTALQVGTPYWIKVSFTGTQYKLELSTDGVEYTLEASKDSTTLLYQQNDSIINIGYMGTDISKYFQGSVDLNESYLKIGSKSVWGKNFIGVTTVKGCLDKELLESSDETIYNAFVKEDNILLTNKEDVEGMVWANKVIVPSHLKAGVYLKNYSQAGSLYVDLGYNASGFGKGAVIYSPIIKANTTDETLCYVFKVKPGKVESTWRILMGNKGGLNHLIGVGDGKWFLWNVSTPAEGGTYEFGSSYWVSVMVYPDQTIVYYMKDDGTFNDVSKLPLPVIRGTTQPYWSTGPTVNTNLFMNTAKWIGAGNDNSDQYWSGSVDLKNTIVYKNHNNFMANTEIEWQPLLTVSEPDKLPDKEWM